MSTRQERPQRLNAHIPHGRRSTRDWFDPGEQIGLIACSRRELLLAVHRHRLGREDLEDCYSQATLELLTRAKRGEAFASRAHINNALEQKFLSRIYDRRRALCGRSPIQTALAGSVSLIDSCSEFEVEDVRADLEQHAFRRHDLRRLVRLSRELSLDQRLVLRSQLMSNTTSAEFCLMHGWSKEKYRKVAQRGRARLVQLLDR